MIKTSRGFKNLFFGIFSQIIIIFLGIIIPKLILDNLGSEVNGLITSITNILGYLSVLEAGVGTASLQALYKPISTKDKNLINEIMSTTNFLYFRTGVAYLISIFIISILYTLFVNTNIPKDEVFFIVLFSGLSGVISYFFQGKLKIYLLAEGKNYISTSIVTIFKVLTDIFKAFMLFYGIKITNVLFVSFIISIIQTLVFLIYFKKNYNWIDFTKKPNFQILSQRKSVLIHQISGLIFNNVDIVILTFMCSLNIVSVYSIYALIFGIIKTITVVISDSFTYKIGQCFSNKDKFTILFNVYEIFNLSITFALFLICTVLINPFLTLYTADIIDVTYVDKYLPLLFAAYYLMHSGRTSSNLVINIAQQFDNTKWQSVLESLINIVCSIFLTYFLGIYGVLLGTIIALLYRTNDMIIFASKVLNRKSVITYKRWIQNIIVFVLMYLFLSFFKIKIDNYFSFIEIAIVLCLTVIPIFVFVNYFTEKRFFIVLIQYIKDKFKNSKRIKKF